MSVLIKGMKMPKDGVIKLAIRGDDRIASVYIDEGKADYYTAVELPDHGDLIDRDALMARKGSAYDIDGHELYAVGTGTILRMPVVIPAERSEDDN